MKNEGMGTIKNYNELPITLTVDQVGEVLGISRCTAYELVHSKGFPVIRVGRRIIISRAALFNWMNDKSGIIKKV